MRDVAGACERLGRSRRWACASRSTTSAPATRRCRTCSGCPWTSSRSTGASSPRSRRRAAEPRAARRRSSASGQSLSLRWSPRASRRTSQLRTLARDGLRDGAGLPAGPSGQREAIEEPDSGRATSAAPPEDARPSSPRLAVILRAPDPGGSPIEPGEVFPMSKLVARDLRTRARRARARGLRQQPTATRAAAARHIQRVRSTARALRSRPRCRRRSNRKGTLTVAADATYAPNEFIAPDGQTVIGMDADLTKALGARHGPEGRSRSTRPSTRSSRASPRASTTSACPRSPTPRSARRPSTS